ncbi:DUF4381 domain-containing protein [Luteolibacter pohnpeiensis]|uniref:DUF4381 domain-containing protein n=1 Tax=Luteolibacter pohnpeiensis TaxID=454153 RepID=A0A934VUW4_9BACT|nr:DUF4381 domain-containing protein [Luteolibacter pohnpeiensis]MBK1880924.1 DUF4381 domain-containing protein [Luteolibacter pohnpeiensis]
MSDRTTSLDRLHDIVEPPPVGWWPLAPGWLMLALVVLIIGIYFLLKKYRHWKSSAYRREAIRQIKISESANTIACILRRTALAIAPRTTLATVYNDQWVDWLAAQTSISVPPRVQKILGTDLYQRSIALSEVSILRDFAIEWIHTHRTPC